MRIQRRRLPDLMISPPPTVPPVPSLPQWVVPRLCQGLTSEKVSSWLRDRMGWTAALTVRDPWP